LLLHHSNSDGVRAEPDRKEGMAAGATPPHQVVALLFTAMTSMACTVVKFATYIHFQRFFVW
jgi:hypothetical protein